MSTTITAPTKSATSTWQIDPSHTQVEFEVTHMMFAKVRGRFLTAEGTLVLGPSDRIGESRVEVVIDSAGIDTGNADRDKHLRSADFFDAETYPELRFESRSVRAVGDGKLRVAGDLTIRGETRQVELDVTESGRGVDPWGGERVGFRASTTIDRRDYGLTWNQALETGGILVGNDVRISIEVQAVRQDA